MFDGKFYQCCNDPDCPLCYGGGIRVEDGDVLPQLNAAEKAAMESLQPDFVDRIIRGERPVTDPTTFAN